MISLLLLIFTGMQYVLCCGIIYSHPSGEPMADTQHIPKFTHDCDECTFLGHADGVDHYHCTNHAELVQRRSSDNIDYSAIPITDLTQLHPTIKRGII